MRLLYAREKVRPEHTVLTPDVDDSEAAPKYQVVSLQALVEMKLVSNRRKDQAHLIDMIHVGLIDATWPARFVPDLAARLQTLLDDPNE